MLSLAKRPFRFNLDHASTATPEILPLHHARRFFKGELSKTTTNVVGFDHNEKAFWSHYFLPIMLSYYFH